jgi:hypothetical protein
MPAKAMKADNANRLQVPAREGTSEMRSLADVGLDPAAHAAITVQLFGKGTFGTLPVTDTYVAVHEPSSWCGKATCPDLRQRSRRKRSR